MHHQLRAKPQPFALRHYDEDEPAHGAEHHTPQSAAAANPSRGSNRTRQPSLVVPARLLAKLRQSVLSDAELSAHVVRSKEESSGSATSAVQASAAQNGKDAHAHAHRPRGVVDSHLHRAAPPLVVMVELPQGKRRVEIRQVKLSVCATWKLPNL